MSETEASSASEFLVGLARSKVGHWEGNILKWLTDCRVVLHRDSPDSAWGFSCSGGRDVEHWGAVMSGLAVSRGEKGLWVSVERVRQDSPAGQADLRPRDFITRINGRIVFHLEPQDVSRLIKNSGKVLYLDVERNGSKNVLYCNGLHNYSYNFLFEDNWEMKKFLY